MAISKRKRFEVFKRDNFTCQYCGRKPPDVLLEADHIVSVYNEGSDEMENLITSCFDCNRGKGKKSLEVKYINREYNTKELKEKEEQYVEYKKLSNQVNKRVEEESLEILNFYSERFPYVSDSYLDKDYISIKRFVSKIGGVEVMDSMEEACSRVKNGHYCMMYFFKICWRKVKELETI